MLIRRRQPERQLRQALGEAPAVLLTGSRQAGKSTLALSGSTGTVVIDGAQLRPDLFPILRVLVDEDRRPGRFLVLGSASPDLVGLGGESLAGRVAFVELTGFDLADVGATHLDRLWLRGGLPESYLAALGLGLSATTMRRVWSMLAHYHGQTWNGAEIGRSVDVSQRTMRRYVDALTDALVVRQLQPWHANISKRQVRSPRVHIRDTGLLHRLLGVGAMVGLQGHPKVGASWEGLVIEHLATRPDVVDAAFWSTHTGAEIDLRLVTGGRVVGVDVKRTDAPSTTKSMHSAIESLDLDHLYLIHGGRHRFALSETITAVPASDVLLAPSALSVFADE
ncbi:MAG: ATP-binding protein [Actinomycetia bacterium]|nr:ATP-binding protein [Actinomycetes bacterium]